MKRLIGLLAVFMLMFSCASAELTVVKVDTGLRQSAILDAAYTCVEVGNAFLDRYVSLTGSTTAARLTLGVPYFYGGQHNEHPFHNEPEYTTRKAWQSSAYFKKDKLYVSGFDCVGFVKYCLDTAGIKLPDAMSKLHQDRFHQKGLHLWCSDKNPMPENWAELAASLQPGDLWLVKHPNDHMMMYVGTLRQYGYTAKTLPELADYLDYPLIIHCAAHPTYPSRFAEYTKTSAKNELHQTLPPDGGVAVSILGVPFDKAPYTDGTLYWFDVEGTLMTTWNVASVESYIWYRDPGK